MAGILLLLLFLGFYFLRSGKPEREALTGAWVVDQDAVAEAPGALAPGDLALVYKGDDPVTGDVRAWLKGGNWKIIEKKDQKFTVEISSPKESPERLQIFVPDGEPLQVTVPNKPGSFELQRPGPRRVRASRGTDQHGSQQAGHGSSSSSQGNANYSLIEKGLYQGGLVSEPPPGTQDVINLCETLDRYQGKIPSYLWVPIADGPPAPSLSWLKEMVNKVDASRRDGQTVYVHCRAGVSRSGMLVTAYCMFEHHWTRDQALQFVRSKRPVTRPNPAFMQLLSEWQLFLQRHSSVKVPSPAAPGVGLPTFLSGRPAA